MPISGFYDPLTAPPGESTLGLFYRSEGWSELWRGVRDGQWRIFKCLKEEYRTDSRYRELLRKEFEITRNLSHPGIRAGLDMLELPGLGPCIEMEFVGGQDLAAAISEGKLTRRDRERIASELLDALDYLHRSQIVHRDLSPANILVSRDGGHVKIIDFEMADSDGQATLKERGGTDGYAAPELFEQGAAGQQCDCRSDIFSLGVILSEMGVAPASVVRKCCALKKEDRYADIGEMRRALTRHRRLRSLLPLSLALGLAALLAGIFLLLQTWLPLGFGGLTLQAADSSTVTVSNPIELTIECSVGGKRWRPYSDRVFSVTLEPGQKLRLRANNAQYAKQVNEFPSPEDYVFTHIKVSGKCFVYGNMMSLLHSWGYRFISSLPGTSTFFGLFRDNPDLFSHPRKKILLPATRLVRNCYAELFSGTSISRAPELPARLLANNCYGRMFAFCDSLKTPPALPSTDIQSNCYRAMFFNCRNLERAPELPAKIMAINCYASMFSCCHKLKEAPRLPATTLAYFCYKWMFYRCESLTEAPELPAKKLARACYQRMFCKCTRLGKTPVLPAATVRDSCYAFMFNGCTALTEIRIQATDISAENALLNWTNDVAPEGTFICRAGTEFPLGASGIPKGWTVVRE